MITVELKQGSPEWHSWRINGIGGSDAPVVEGSSPYNTKRGLYLLKRGEIELDEQDSSKEFLFARGHATEALVRNNFREQFGVEMNPVCAIHKDFNFVRASLDGFDAKKYGVLEAKMVGKAVLEDARDEGIIPRHHWVQIQHNMEVANVDLAQWYGHNGKDNGILIEVKKDNKFIDQLLEQEQAFWEAVKTGKIPDLCKDDDLIPQDLTLLKAIYDAKVQMDNAEALFESLKAQLDSYNHPRLRGGGITASKGSREGNLDVKKIPGVKTLLDNYTEKYKEKFRNAPGKESWTVRIEKVK